MPLRIAGEVIDENAFVPGREDALGIASLPYRLEPTHAAVSVSIEIADREGTVVHTADLGEVRDARAQFPASAPTCETPAALLNDTTFTIWRDEILPSAQESAWRAIPWRPSLHEGLVDAEAAGKPILLWLMNGHPLGCT